MKTWGVRVAAVLGIALAVGLTPTMTFECGPSASSPVFVTKNPEDATAFMNGNLGVVRPTFSGWNLFIAYRTLQGAPLTAREVDQLKAPLHEKGWYFAGTVEDKEGDPYLALRSTIPNLPMARMVNHYKDREEYNEYLNCADDAFRMAAQTLQERIAQFGKDGAEVHDWVIAQDTVFDNCDHKDVRLPMRAAAAASAMVRADREYQTAAAHFYGEDYDDAAELFQKIGGERWSQWHDWGLYLTARAYVRKATIESRDEKATKEAFAAAERVLRMAVKDPTLVKMKAKNESLLGFVMYRTNPQRRAAELAEALSGKAANENFHQDLRDYLLLIPNARGAEDEMGDWIRVAGGKETGQNTAERWRREPRSLPWLVAALMAAKGTDNGIADVLQAGLKIPAASVAYATARYNAARLLVEQGKTAEARKLIDGYLATKPKTLGQSSENLFLALRAKAASDLTDFARFAERRVVAEGDEYMGMNDEPCGGGAACPGAMLDETSAIVVNHLPMEELIALSKAKAGSDELRRTAARLAFTRALLLGDDAPLTASAEGLAALSAEMAKDVKPVLEAKTADDRRASATLAVMQWPGGSFTVQAKYLRDGGEREMNSYHDNWWCDGGTGGTWWSRSPVKGVEEYPGFLNDSQRKAAVKEQNNLAAAGAAPDFFGGVVIPWARKNPQDPRVPVALQQVVRAVHLGCGGPKSTDYGKAAFSLLHQRYPTSAAAKATKYRYDSDYQPPQPAAPNPPNPGNPR